MRTAAFAAAALLALSLLLLNRACHVNQEPAEDAAFPALLDDHAFLADLDRIGEYGRKGIVVVAPSSGLKGENRDKAFLLAEKLAVRFPTEAMDEEAVPYNANADETRLRLFLAALADQQSEMLWAVRGGYGSSRLLPELEKSALPAEPKIIVGYSDITFLHLFFQKKGWLGVHGGMFWELRGTKRDDDNFRLLARLVSGQQDEFRYGPLEALNVAAKEAAYPLSGVLAGGNLTCVANAEGTPWALEAAGRVLFFEDVDEKGYKIDRMLTQLAQAGKTEAAAAIVFGAFVEGDDNVRFALERFARDCPKPVYRTDVFGHGEKNYPLVINAPVAIANEGGKIELRMRNPFPPTKERPKP